MTTTSTVVNVTVVRNVPPSVSITSPANNAGVGTSFTISATAADTGGTVTSVAFYDGTTLLGTDTSSPYSYTWNAAPLGGHALTAKATDDSGLTTTSAVVNVTVSTGPVPFLSQNFEHRSGQLHPAGKQQPVPLRHRPALLGDERHPRPDRQCRHHRQ